MVIKDLLECKGKRGLAPVKVAREEETNAVAEAAMDMIVTAFIPERAHFAKAVAGLGVISQGYRSRVSWDHNASGRYTAQ